MEYVFTRDWKIYKAGKRINFAENSGYIKLLLRRGILRQAEVEEAVLDTDPPKRKRGRPKKSEHAVTRG